MADLPRSASARAAAESALVRVVQAYGGLPSFVLLGGLVPELLCSSTAWRHAGTTDVDVQVNLEITNLAGSAGRLEQALESAGFSPDSQYTWRWRERSPVNGVVTEVKFELLADLHDHPAEATVNFDAAKQLGAVNLRGTGYAALDAEIRSVRASEGDGPEVQINVSGLAGFLLAKTAAAYGRRKEKDWYDIAFVLLHNDAGGPQDATSRVMARFGGCPPELRSAMRDLQANFVDDSSQGVMAYVDQFCLDHPEQDPDSAAGDAMLAVAFFTDTLT